MSATADYMFRQLENMNVVEAEQKYNVDKDTGYVDKVMVYWNDDQLACWLDCIPEGEKALVFMKSTDAVKKWRNKYGDMAVGYCSSNNAKTKKADNLYLHGQFYGATHNYTGVEGADDEAVRNRIEAQTAQFFRQTLLWGDAVNSGVEIKENIPLLYALGVKTSGCMRGDFLFVCSFSAACLSGDKMLYSKYVLIIRKEEETWIL